MRVGVLFYCSALVLAASVMLGGGTRGGFLSDVILQVISVPLIIVALWHLARPGVARGVRWAIVACLLLLLVPLLQLLPLSPRIWSLFPARSEVTTAHALLNAAPTWLPVSVSPHNTWLAVLSLLPPIALFAGVALLGAAERRRLSLVVLAIGVVSVFLGLLQVAQGPASPLRLFAVTNPSEAVGFFANRNHFAALLFCLTLLAAAWAADATWNIETRDPRQRFELAAILPLAVSFIVLVALVAAQTTARSRAGLGLTIVALFGAFALTLPDRFRRRQHRDRSGFSSRILIGAVVVAVVLGLQFSLYRILDRFDADPLADARLPFARNTIAAAKTFMPLGSGVGSFVPVYAGVEPPQDVLANTFANRAHNDFLESWLETGVVGVALMALFGLWLLVRAFALWRPASSGSRIIDHALPRAAVLVVALLIAHSLVDYPLRTGALMGMFAFASALLLPPPVGPTATEPDQLAMAGHGRERRPVSEPRFEAPMPVSVRQPAEVAWPQATRSTESVVAGTSAAGASVAGERWGKNIEWPEAWRKQPQPTAAVSDRPRSNRRSTDESEGAT